MTVPCGCCEILSLCHQDFFSLQTFLGIFLPCEEKGSAFTLLLARAGSFSEFSSQATPPPPQDFLLLISGNPNFLRAPSSSGKSKQPVNTSPRHRRLPPARTQSQPGAACALSATSSSLSGAFGHKPQQHVCGGSLPPPGSAGKNTHSPPPPPLSTERGSPSPSPRPSVWTNVIVSAA